MVELVLVGRLVQHHRCLESESNRSASTGGRLIDCRGLSDGVCRFLRRRAHRLAVGCLTPFALVWIGDVYFGVCYFGFTKTCYFGYFNKLGFVCCHTAD